MASAPVPAKLPDLPGQGNDTGHKQPSASAHHTAAQQPTALQNGFATAQPSKRQRQHASQGQGQMLGTGTALVEAPDAAQYMHSAHQQAAQSLQRQPAHHTQSQAQLCSLLPSKQQQAQHVSAQQVMGMWQGRNDAVAMQYPSQHQAPKQNHIYGPASIAVPAAQKGPRSPVHSANLHSAVLQSQNTDEQCAVLGQQQEWLHPQHQLAGRSGEHAHMGQQHVAWQTQASPMLYSPNFYSPTALHGGPWRLPVAKQQMSMNALARTAYHT